MSKAKDGKPLALANTLRDLALLRVSDLDVSALLPSPAASSNDILANDLVNDSVDQSYLFVREARTAMRIHDRADVAVQGGRVEDVRGKLDELASGVLLRD
ncbi:hypothetical protein FPV67DRAFT_1011162 [Lyophyllum atratum]|nr:hypothetical protein FPV67DRAFT_1441166 [Lyophyllum atratum]KAF8070300.1 hypothetical protein FPV67DRAFT_1011162 [Lyophyllum atratum]